MEAMRRDTLACRACLYIEGESLKNRDEWNIQDPPNLIGPRQGLHMFHVSSFLPVLDMFMEGVGKDMWGDDDTVGYNSFNFVGNAPRSRAKVTRLAPLLSPIARDSYKGDVTDEIMFFNTKNDKNEYRAVQWAAPQRLEGFSVLSDLIRECLQRAGRVRLMPSNELLVPGCKPCNDIMTQRGTMAQLLVRNKVSSKPLVPLEAILSIELNGKPGSLSYSEREAKYRWDPNTGNRDGDQHSWTSQACYAYYAHRCLPNRPAVLPPSAAAVAVGEH